MESAIPIVAIFPFVVGIIVVLGFFGLVALVIVSIARLIRSSNESGRLSRDETQLLESMSRSLDQMDRRIENLETILRARGAAKSDRREY